MAPWSLELERRETTSEAAERGKVRHAGAEAIYIGFDVSFAQAPAGSVAAEDHRVFQHIRVMYEADRDVALDDKGPGGTSWWVEQGIRYRPGFPADEAELCERKPGQEERGWFSGTADLVYMRADGVLVVVDWKFGHLTERIGDPAEEHWQLWFLALAFATHLGIDMSDVSRVVARVELRHVDEYGCRVDGADVTAGELATFAAELVKIQRRIVGDNENSDKMFRLAASVSPQYRDPIWAYAESLREPEGPRIGQACGRCSARAACDAYQGLMATAVEAITGSVYGSLLYDVSETTDGAVAQYRMLDAAKKALPLLEENVKTYLRAHGDLDIGMGQKLRAKASQAARVVNTQEAIVAAAETLGVEPARFTKPRMTKDLLKRAWAEANGKKRSGKDAKAVEQEWVARGFLSVGAASSRVVIARSDGTEVNAWKQEQEDDED